MYLHANDMTHGSPLRLIFTFSLPLIVGNLFQQLYTAVDSMIVGHGVGVNALASLGASDWIYWLFLWSIQGFTAGISALVAQAFGKREPQILHKTIAASIVLCGVFSLILTIFSFIFIRPILVLLHTPEEVFAGAHLYLTILCLGHIIVVAYNLASGILRALGNSRLPLIAMVIASCINVVLDLLFVFLLHFDIAGAAAATLIAQLCAFLICAFGIFRMPEIHFTSSHWKNNFRMHQKICAIALPLSFQHSMIAVGGMFVQSALNGLGVVYIAAFTASNKLNAILECIAAAFGNGLSTYMGQNYGAGKSDRLDQGIRSVLLLAVIFSTLIGGGMILSGRFILGLFISSSDPAAPEILSVAYRYLVILCLALFILFLIHIYRNALQGLGKITGPVISGFMELILRIGVVLLIPILGSQVIFFTEVSAWIGTAVELVIAYYISIGSVKRSIQQKSNL